MRLRKSESEINYLFFSCALIYLIVLSVCHIFSKESSFFGIQAYFLIHAAGQAFLEVIAFIWIGYWIKRFFPLWIYKGFIGVAFLLLLGHFVDFVLVRLMDTSILYAFKLFFAEGFHHFFAALFALNLNHTILFIILSALICIPLLGIVFYWFTFRITRKKPLKLSQFQLIKTLFSVTLILLVLDLGAKSFLDPNTYSQYRNTLPLKTTFLSPSGHIITLKKSLRPPRKEKKVLEALEQKQFNINEKPNIFLFVVETLRGDYITEEIAPHLSLFKKENISPSKAFSNANATHLSWYSIFHSNLPYHWPSVKRTWETGSIPLRILKELGYKIRVYTAAELYYYKLDELIFGKNFELIDTIHQYAPTLNETSCFRDRKAMKQLFEDIEKEDMQEGQVFLIFLDSTHSEYSWPDNFPAKFTPYSPEIDYIQMSNSKKNLDLVKNRYRNSIHFVDHLFGQFFDHLKNVDNSIIAITGDHGEEFFENGAMFHGTHINNAQTIVPIFFKFPGSFTLKTNLASHIDIFPSILHYLLGEAVFSNLFDGQSLFSENKWPYVLTVKQNGGQVPYEFFVHNGSYKVIARFFDYHQLEILSIQDKKDKTLPIEPENYEKFLSQELPNAFEFLIE